MSLRRLASVGAGLAIGLTLPLVSTPARACGGFFCDQPPANNPTPLIAQAGENVVFVLGRDPATGAGTVEAHVQILYTGAADQFSWIVPMNALPTLDIGNDILFQILEPRTRPAFNMTWTTDGTCKGQAQNDTAGCAGAKVSAGGSNTPSSFDAGTAGRGPVVDVAFRGNVGPFESAVVRSDDPAALEKWLTDNKYYVSPQASLIIKDYVATGSYFVALRLQMGLDVKEIRPIVLRLAAEEGCLPLKLTAIASTPDLRVNVWVLGAGRAIPLNYREVTLNMLKLDWFSGGANYDRIVSTAANEAGGNAFLTEYAQPAAMAVPWFTVPTTASGQLALATTPFAFWNVVVQQLGLPLSGRVLQIFRQFIPVPPSLIAGGVTEAQFYAGLQNFWFSNQAAFAPFDFVGAAAAMNTEVLLPMGRFRELFQSHTTLTRVATFISPEEMTKDPLFVTNQRLPMVSNLHTATARVQCGDEEHNRCDAPVRLDIDETGRSLWFKPPADSCNVVFPPAYGRADLDADFMPAADKGWRRDVDGEGTVEVDNGTQIAVALSMHNAAVTGEGCACAVMGRAARGPLAALALLSAAALWLRRRRPR